MQYKTFSICLDMQQELPFHPFEVVEGDTGNVLELTLLNNGESLLLNDCAVVVAFTSSMGFAMQDETSGITIGEEAGKLTLLLDPESYGPGNVSADVQVYSGPGHRVLVTSTRFDFRCKRSLISEEIIRANAAYPPLISATQDATAAAAEARTAVAGIEGRLGELNVQADWTETDSASDAFILHRPQTPWDLGAPEEIHAYQHASAGDDPVTPASIGATVRNAVTATLTVAGWVNRVQTVAVSSATPSNTVIVSPTVASGEKYGMAGIYCSAQGNGTLTFTCEYVPDSALTVNILTFS